MPSRVLVVDDEPNIVSSFTSLLADEGLQSVGVGFCGGSRGGCGAPLLRLNPA